MITYTGDTDGETLELTTREQRNITIIDMTQLQDIQDLLEVVELLRLVHEELHRLLGTPDGPRKLVNVLRLDHRGQIVLQELCEVILQLGTSEVFDDVLPVWRVVESSQIGLQLATENLERCTLSDTVCSNETQHLSWSGHGQSVELEAVGRVSMGHLALEVRWQVDDGDGAEGALLRADTASDAKGFGDEGKSRVGGHFDAWNRRAGQ